MPSDKQRIESLEKRLASLEFLATGTVRQFVELGEALKNMVTSSQQTDIMQLCIIDLLCKYNPTFGEELEALVEKLQEAEIT